MSTIEERITKTLAFQLRLDIAEIQPQAHLIDDLGADSLDEVEVVMALEEEFDLEISDEDAEKWHTVADITTYITAAKAVPASA